MTAQYSVAFLSFLVVFMANAVRYSLQQGELVLPFAARLSREREPRKFYLALAAIACVSLVSFVAVSGYVWKMVA
jgi:bacteriorhodopsin